MLRYDITFNSEPHSFLGWSQRPRSDHPFPALLLRSHSSWIHGRGQGRFQAETQCLSFRHLAYYEADVHQEQVGNGSVLHIKSVKKRSLWGYKGDEIPLFLKITCSDPRTIPKVRDKSNSFQLRLTHPDPSFQLLRLFDRGELSFKDLFPGPVTTYESNLPYILRFMVDQKVAIPGAVSFTIPLNCLSRWSE